MRTIKTNYKNTLSSLLLVGILGFSLNVSAKKTTFQTSNGFNLNGYNASTAGTMVRTKQSVTANLALSNLETNSAYTVWWIVFNKPENCTHPIAISSSACGEEDVPDAVFNAAGFVTGNNGNANITVRLNAGKLPIGLQVLKPGMLKRGKGFKAEFHMVISTHGAILPDRLAEQIGSIGGGCDVNICADQSAIIFPPEHVEPTEHDY